MPPQPNDGAHERAASIFGLDSRLLPSGFPNQYWNRQSNRYAHDWAWMNGDILNEYTETKKGGKIYKFPLAINFIRALARKHCALLFGEVPDSPTPMVRMLAEPKKPIGLKDDEDNDQNPEVIERKRISAICEQVLNDVWMQSNGRALMQEGGVLSQFLGGHSFQLSWEPERDDLEFPIVIKGWPVDFFLPIWAHDNYYDLLEAYIVCRIPMAVAHQQYPLNDIGAAQTGSAVYVQHWKKDTYSIFINAQPLKVNEGGEIVTYLNIPNPWGFVPMQYIAHLREGGFYGNSHVPDVEGLIKEYNARLADMGDIVRDTARRTWLARNLGQTVGEVQLADGINAIDLGQQRPSQKDPPDAWTEDPPALSQGMADLPDALWQQLLRDSYLSPIAFGEDEGSQRSGLTLDIRFWPGTSHARQERTFWIEAVLHLNRMILKMLQIKGLIDVPPGFLQKIDLKLDWFPQIPRDAEQQSNDLILKYQAGLKSLHEGVAAQSDVRDVELEVKRIHEDMEFEAKLDLLRKPAATDQKPPQAQTGLQD